MANMPPLAEQMRPSSLDDYIGQGHLTGKGSILRQAMQSGNIPSMILWGETSQAVLDRLHFLLAYATALVIFRHSLERGLNAIRRKRH